VLSTEDSQLDKAIHEHTDAIKHETLASHLVKEGSGTFEMVAKVEGSELVVKLSKAD
jgi:hypothetical protein